MGGPRCSVLLRRNKGLVLLSALCCFFIPQVLYHRTQNKGKSVEDIIAEWKGEMKIPLPPEMQGRGQQAKGRGRQEDGEVEKVLEKIRANHLFPPPGVSFDPQGTNNNNNPANEEKVDVIIDILGLQKNSSKGVFVECGANDGEFDSKTLRLETEFGWTGLLIEGSPSVSRKLIKSGRNVWKSNACVSTKIEQVNFVKPKEDVQGQGRFQMPEDLESENFEIEAGVVKCFPLPYILAAAKMTTVDFLALDVQGQEYKIMKNLFASSITIAVDAVYIRSDLTPEGDKKMERLFRKYGYEVMEATSTHLLFMHRSKIRKNIYQELNL